MKIIKITHKKAAEWLKRNICNRPLSDSTVAEYSGAMQAGAWELNGETIKFNCNGDLIDGQHRLHACMMTGIAFESYVVFGIRQEAFDTIDQGDGRTIGDVFARHGYKHYTLLASSVRWVWRYENKMKIQGAMRQDVARAIIERHPALHTAAQVASEHARSGLINPGLMAFLDYWCGQNDQQRADKFWISVAEAEGLEKGTPAHLLHKTLQKNANSVAKLWPITKAAFAIKAWNAHFSKKPCAILKFDEREAFPTILF